MIRSGTRRHADSISRPLLLLQGLDDKVVPPAQSELIVDALKERGIPHAYIAFADGTHAHPVGSLYPSERQVVWLPDPFE